jgi:hypothetical protein
MKFQIENFILLIDTGCSLKEKGIYFLNFKGCEGGKISENSGMFFETSEI